MAPTEQAMSDPKGKKRSSSLLRSSMQGVLTDQQIQEIRERSYNSRSIIQDDEDWDRLVQDSKARIELGQSRILKKRKAEKSLDTLHAHRILDESIKKQLSDHASSAMQPCYLYRTASNIGQKSTNGYDSLTLHLPEAHMKDWLQCADRLEDAPSLRKMLGRRFLWEDRNADETLSWTRSMLFAIVHATSRRAKGQQEISIFVINPNTAKNIPKRSTSFDNWREEDGMQKCDAIMLPERPARFYHAEYLLQTLKIAKSRGFSDRQRGRLRALWFTHEWISHGAISSEVDSFEARLDDLLESGLYEYLPGLRPPRPEQSRGLYDLCLYVRSIHHNHYGTTVAFTVDELKLVYRLAQCFLSQQVRDRATDAKPPLFIFLDLLSLKSRPSRDPIFMQWMTNHYNEHDILSVHYDRIDVVANNLPEQLQTLALATDVYNAFNLDPIPEVRIWLVDPAFTKNGKWNNPFPKELKIRQPKSASKTKKGITSQLADAVLKQNADQAQPGDSENDEGSTGAAVQDGGKIRDDKGDANDDMDEDEEEDEAWAEAEEEEVDFRETEGMNANGDDDSGLGWENPDTLDGQSEGIVTDGDKVTAT